MIIYQNYAAEMLSKIGRISEMVKHSPSIGGFHESIVKSYLKNFLSKRFSIKTGFIRNFNNGAVSHQIDILVIDENVPSAYLFQDGDFAVVTPNAVVCAIEIKTHFNQNELHDIVNKAAKYRLSNPIGLNLFGLCFKTSSSKYETVGKWFNKIKIEDVFTNYPSSISILDDCILQFYPSQLMEPAGVGVIRCYEHIENKSEAILTQFLFSIMKQCELKANIETSDTINALFNGEIDKFFEFKHYGFKYGLGCVDIQELKAPGGKLIYKRGNL